jgi:hypothetical protein
MTITSAFAAVVTAILLGGTLYRCWDESHRLRFTDETGTGEAVRALARFESGKVLTHPTWLITLAVVTTLTTTLIMLEPGGAIPSDAPVIWFAVIGGPVAALALVVSLHRIGTRSLRHRTDELEAATPTAPRTRTMALLVACLAPVPVLLGAIAVGVITSQLAYSLMPPPTASTLFPVVGFLLAGVGGAVVGVFLSRWLPFAVAPLLGIVAIVWLNNGVEHLHPRFRWLRVAVEADYGGRFDVRPVGWSAIFITGLVVLGACLALWRHPARPALVGATATAVLVVVGTGWTMTRGPSTAEIADRVDLLEHPTDHQHCESRGVVEYCVYPGAESWIDAWDPAARAVLAQVPVAARPTSIDVVQRSTVGTSPYLAEVGERLEPARAWPADGRLHPPLWLEDERTPDMTVAWQTAAVAVGLPPATDWERPSGCLAGGQARVVLAHLLAARATATTRRALELKTAHVRDGELWTQPIPMDLEYDYADESTGPPGGAEIRPSERLAADGASHREFIAVTGASGWGSDVLAADALMDADRATVDRVIRTHWYELVDPTTPTSRLLELAGIDPSVARADAPGTLTEVTEAVACP